MAEAKILTIYSPAMATGKGFAVKNIVFCIAKNVLRIFLASRIFLAGLFLMGCDVNSLSGGENEKAIVTWVFNYTKNELRYASYQDAEEEFNVLTAAPIGSTRFNGLAVKDLGSGITANYDSDICCFRWRYTTKDEVLLKVIWLEVYNPARYDREESANDPRSLSESLPGSQWCEATVKVKKPFPSDPGGIVFHFLPDGEVEAIVAASGVADGFLPYSSASVLQHPSSQTTLICKNKISNPWYLIPRPKHRE